VPLAVAVACLTAIVIFTLAYIYPINAVLFEQAGGDRSATEIAEMVRTWIWADRIRFCVGVVAFIAILRTFRLPLPQA
jgi:nicotinamide riboside transporter PnuC